MTVFWLWYALWKLFFIISPPINMSLKWSELSPPVIEHKTRNQLKLREKIVITIDSRVSFFYCKQNPFLLKGWENWHMLTVLLTNSADYKSTLQLLYVRQCLIIECKYAVRFLQPSTLPFFPKHNTGALYLTSALNVY